MSIVEHTDTVRPEWIDSNGHMNLAYYVVVFDLATDRLYDALGIGNAYREATGNSCFTAETHTIYEREVKVGDGLRVATRTGTGHAVLFVNARRNSLSFTPDR